MTAEVRRLAAIMFTDIVGYSAKSQSNENLALELLELHQKMVRGILDVHQGKEIKTIGDAFMVEFASALSAVNCAIAIQKQMDLYNTKAEDERQIYLRIGVHVGDVVEREGDIFGDGVNISSRLEPLAQPGGICISEDVARQVMNKLDVPVEKMNKKELKNIDLPVQTYQILLYANPEATPIKSSFDRLAVLPFQNFSPDRDTDYFSDGLTEEITMHLSRLQNLKVVSRTTSMRYKNSEEDMETIGKALRARYILEGSVRKHGDNLRITAQLIDVAADEHMWAETYRGNMEDIFDIQENVSKKIVEALRLTLSPEEQVALKKRATVNSEAFDVNLRAREYLFKVSKSYILSAIDLFQKAIDHDVRYAAAYAGMSEAYALLYETHDQKEEWLDKAMEASLQAMMYDSSSSEAYSALGYVYYIKKEYDKALMSIFKSIELDHDNIFGHWILGRIYFVTDRNHEAAIQYKKLLDLNPNFQTAFSDLSMIYEKLNDEEKLDELTERALEFYPDYLIKHPDDARAHIFYASFLQRKGQIEEAKKKMSRAIELSPTDVNMKYNAACFFALINEVDESISFLKQALGAGFGNYEYIKHDPDLDNIRTNPNYVEMMKGH